jgi:integrase
MAKPISLKPKKNAAGIWTLNVPESVSPNNRRQRLTFETKKAADMEAERLKSISKQWGTESVKISAALSQDAAQAAEILEGYDITLSLLARQYVEAQEERARSKSFADVWLAFEDSRELKSDDHKRGLARLGRNMNPLIGKKLVIDLKPSEIRTAIKKEYKSAHGYNLALRSISPAFNMAIREGWLHENPCQKLERIDTGRRDEIAALTLNQCRQLISSCKDYRKDKDKKLHENLRVDCRKAVAAISIMLFAGVRPTEVTRLDWEDIDVEEGTILVSNKKAKTDRSRFFVMPDVLKEWIETIPSEDRLGSVCPANWKRIIQAIRNKSGIADSGRDQLRKTFATMHLAHFNDVNLTRSIMGHENGDVLFTNYRGVVKPKIAAEFWAIRPTSNEVKKQAVG